MRARDDAAKLQPTRTRTRRTNPPSSSMREIQHRRNAWRSMRNAVPGESGVRRLRCCCCGSCWRGAAEWTNQHSSGRRLAPIVDLVRMLLLQRNPRKKCRSAAARVHDLMPAAGSSFSQVAPDGEERGLQQSLWRDLASAMLQNMKSGAPPRRHPPSSSTVRSLLREH